MNRLRDRVGRYELTEPIGHGGMAVVYAGYDAELGRPVAVKLLADNLASDESFRKRFLREAQLAARLQHPNIVQIYDTGEDAGRPFIVMEYVEGLTLAALLAREGRIQPGRAVELAIQACAGLDHAHSAGLVHRDIKPQNLLLREDGTLKIVDFGIARSASGTRLTEIGSVLGTAAYLAPEQAAGGETTAAADIYALGVVIYEMLGGRTPYSYETLTELLVTQTPQPIPPLSEHAREVTAELEDIVMCCLARLPEYRPPSAAHLASQLASAAPELATQALPSTNPRAIRTATPPFSTAPTFQNRTRVNLDRRVLLTAGAILAAVIAALFTVAAGDNDSAPAPHSGKPALEQAQDLSQWLRAQSR